MTIASYGFIIIGGILFGLGLFFHSIEASVKRRCDSRTTAKVIEVKAKINSNVTNGGRESTTYHPVLEYYANGEQLQLTSSTGSNPSKYSVGQAVTLFYDSKHPTSFIIEGEKTGSFLSVAVCSAGVLLILIGIVLLFVKFN